MVEADLERAEERAELGEKYVFHLMLLKYQIKRVVRLIEFATSALFALIHLTKTVVFLNNYFLGAYPQNKIGTEKCCAYFNTRIFIIPLTIQYIDYILSVVLIFFFPYPIHYLISTNHIF